jgi:predicted permease
MRRIWLRLVRRRRFERDFEAEVAFHREMAKAGGNPLPFGNQAVIAEQARDLWRFTVVENLWRDVVYGARSLVRQPALVASAVLSLALGVGANATIFSLGMELLLSEPSVADGASLVSVRNGGNSHTSLANLDALRESGLFADVAGQREQAALNWHDGQETRAIFVVVTTKNFFAVTGYPVALGRGTLPSDPDEVAVLAHEFWSRHFGRDPGVIGRTVTFDGRPFTIVGVLAPATRTLAGIGFAPDAYVPPLSANELVAMYGRLEPGMSLEQTRAAARVLGQSADAGAAAAPDPLRFASLQLQPVGGLRNDPQLLIVVAFFAATLAVTMLVLVLACVNVAGLLLSRGVVRQRELAIRAALGADPRRLLLQLLVESLLLAGAGTAAGRAVTALLGAKLSTIRLPLPIPIVLHAAPDWRVVAFAATLAAAATLLCGVLPAWQSVRASLAPALRRDRRLRLRPVLVAGQVAVSFVVIAAALLFVRNLAAAGAIDPGFDTERTIRATANLSPRTYGDSASINDFISRALAVLQAVPGVEAAAAVRSLPFTDRNTRGHAATWSSTGETAALSYVWNAVSPDYFKAMDIPVLLGRPFTQSDASGPRVVVVNRAFVDRYLNGRPPVGETYVVPGSPPRLYQIVGVAGSVKTLTIGEDDRPQLYERLSQIGGTRQRIDFVARVAGVPASHLAAVRAALRGMDSSVGLDVSPLRSSMTLAFLPSQAGAALMSAAGGLGLLLVAVGLFGTMTFSVAQRTREIGVRMALGATRALVVRMVVLECAGLVGAGSVVGAVVAWFAARPLAAFLVPGLSPNDPTTFALVVPVIALTSLAATWSPARRAARINPVVSLNAE